MSAELEARQAVADLPPDAGELSGAGLAPRQCARRFTKTQEALLRYIAGETALHGGACCTKRDLAKMLGRSIKTVDRSVAALRRTGVIEAEMRFDEESGAQMSSVYRVNFDVMPP